ncbi:hypothetical protein MED121_23975 [Marinomonas sp. MED121]|uniref:extracellular solute-binding protein n=1 Tax=Marinomonas sp. MED121 TaxID=314277 RepID=UPI000068FE2D|nr:extracellular solute-binding protein [Marinomonas sp. MED121]EAQ63435.1 hypothetical protein MED121_23975 [Marinomonas sp. MED121]
MKINRFLMSSFIPLVCLSTPSYGQDEVNKSVNFYNWNDYITEEALESFTQKTGVKIQYDLFDSVDTVETKLLTGASGYDVVMSDASRRLKRQIKAGAFQKLDKSKLTNYQNIDPQILGWIENFDNGNLYALPYMWGTTGLGYNVNEVNQRLPHAVKDGWGLLLNPDNVSKLADCGVMLLDDVEELYVATLLYLGKDINEASSANLKLVESHLKKIRPYIRSFSNSMYMTNLASGESCLAVGYNGSIFMVQDTADQAGNGIKLNYVIPKEGATLWFDAMGIPVDAPNPDNAHLLLDHLMEGEIMAGISNLVRFANGYSASVSYLESSLVENPGIYPPESIKNRLVPLPNFTPSFEKKLRRMWNRIKAGT